jgi:hypothetical protein
MPNMFRRAIRADDNAVSRFLRLFNRFGSRQPISGANLTFVTSK